MMYCHRRFVPAVLKRPILLGLRLIIYSDVNMRFGEETLDAYLSRLEIETIEDALHQASYNKAAAARLLGIGLGALRYRMQKLQME